MNLALQKWSFRSVNNIVMLKAVTSIESAHVATWVFTFGENKSTTQ